MARIDEDTAGEYPSPAKSNYEIDFPALQFLGRPGWRDEAYCRGHEEWTPVFFMEKSDRIHSRSVMVEEAQYLCSKCTVRKDCFLFAMNNKIRHGIWGGYNFQSKHFNPEDVLEFN